MKVLFAGPSLHGLAPDLSEIDLRAPAVQGDIAEAVLEGTTAIGLIDGNFEAVASVWHKEILMALASGVAMFGASSMGALRAAECASFGMVPVGAIAEAYASGTLDDDAAVALLHGPKELDYLPFTEALVNVGPTLDRMLELRLLSADEREEFWREASRLYFKDRSVDAIFAKAENRQLPALYEGHRVNRKGEDALLLVSELRKSPDVRTAGTGSIDASSFFARKVLPDLRSRQSLRDLS